MHGISGGGSRDPRSPDPLLILLTYIYLLTYVYSYASTLRSYTYFVNIYVAIANIL